MKRPQSIWGGIDLAAIANDVAEAKAEAAIAEAMSQPTFPEDVPPELMPTTVEVVSDAKDVTGSDASLPQPLAVEEAPMAEASNAKTGGRRTRKKRRWQKDVSLPRGQRWKRRLPWLLRRIRA
ncbi:hypothetical protein MesoLj131c_65720 (plasmid) [Mesorhizobium sp. 131-3-5]|uniref:hypothetical protein n=1 Tax=Mesorhizobium sp. 131-3-5 TaxID=2744520 RepID=UPI0018EE16C9|nr:hypothetical protein [Mesorhizobium sp. 131-3-5]BCH12314.1 hypothetical protein MesoLj131c_65720 [Mesorhizobium sp. 131-3-5]